MKKKIIILGTVLAVFLMMMMPNLTAVEVQTFENKLNTQHEILPFNRLQGLSYIMTGLKLSLTMPIIIILSPLIIKLYKEAGYDLNKALLITLALVFMGPITIKIGLVMVLKNIPEGEVNTPFLDLLFD